MYCTRARKAPDGSMRLLADVPSAATLEKEGATVVHATAAQLMLDDLFYLSGEIPRQTAFETGLPGQYRRSVDGSTWEPDPLLMDERYLAVKGKGKGVIVFTACSHAGVVNVLTDARRNLPDALLHGVLGGFHLSGANEKVIPETIDALRPFELKTIAAAHCTDWRAVGALAAAFGDAVVPSEVGKRYRL